MTTPTRQPGDGGAGAQPTNTGNGGAEEQPSGTGYSSSLAARPHALAPPGPRPSRWAELAAMLAWVLGSWLRPGDAEAAWEQRAGREHREP